MKRSEVILLICSVAMVIAGIVIIEVKNNQEFNKHPQINLRGDLWECTKTESYAVGMAMGSRCTQYNLIGARP